MPQRHTRDEGVSISGPLSVYKGCRMLGASGNKQKLYASVNAEPVQSDSRQATARNATIAIREVGMPIGAPC